MKKQTETVHIEIALPPCSLLLGNSGKNKEHLNDVYLAFREELSKTTFIDTIDHVDISLMFRFVKRQEYSEQEGVNFVKQFFGSILVADAEVDLSSYIEERTKAYLEAISSKENNFTNNDWLKQCRFDFCDEVKRMILNVVIVTNLVYPGCMEIGEGQISINDQCYVKLRHLNTSLWAVHEEILEKYWPKLEDVSLKETWDWVVNKLNYSATIGTTSANRALNAFSYQFNADNYEDLFYCLLGVEALYNTSSSDGIMEQIRVKTSILFGEPAEYKKRISQMYKIRSSFVHGSLDFPNKFFTFDADPQFEDFIQTKYREALTTAQCILVASLRLLIKHQAIGFRSEITITYD